MELKPCPFCGKQPTTHWNFSEPYYEEGYNIDCCCIHICRSFKEDAVEVWNSRHPNQAIHSDGEKCVHSLLSYLGGKNE